MNPSMILNGQPAPARPAAPRSPASPQGSTAPRSSSAPAPTWAEILEDILLALAPYAVAAMVVALAVVAAAVVALVQPAWLPQLAASLAGVQPKVYWYLSRSSAIVGYFMLWASMIIGLAITNKLARAWPGGPTFAALHEHTSWLGLVLSAFHAIILIFDGYIGYNLTQLLVPFASANYRPLWVGLGQIALYLMALVVLSFYLRRWINYRLWRTIHYLSFAVFALGLLHGLLSGTDSAGLVMVGVYWASALSVVGLLVYRIRHGLRAAPDFAIARQSAGFAPTLSNS
jgi:predicted ferric reductase